MIHAHWQTHNGKTIGGIHEKYSIYAILFNCANILQDVMTNSICKHDFTQSAYTNI
jgi:hypothetical protein